MSMEQEIAGEILADYSLGRDIDNMQSRYRPEKQTITDMIGRMMAIVYPGVWGGGRELPALVREVLACLQEQGKLIFRQSMEDADAERQARAVSAEFFRAVPRVRGAAQTDAEAFFEGDPAATCMDEIICCYPGLFAITVYRLAHVLYTLGLPMLPRIMTEHAHSITGIDIHPGAKVGKYFFIDHGTGIVIGQTTVIGDHVKIYQGVTLGALTTRGGQSLRGKKRHPTIEDNVTIYAGASILGGDTVIGRDSVIGSNVFITSSVPPCTRVSVKNQELQLRPRECRGCPRVGDFGEE